MTEEEKENMRVGKIFLITIFILFGSSLALMAFATDMPPEVSITVADPAPIMPKGTVPVAEVAAPPEWAENMIVAVQQLPVIGPIASKILLWLGIISAILTSVVACAITIIAALQKVMTLAGLTQIAIKLHAFRASPIMYWLTYLSMFNAKKPGKPLSLEDQIVIKQAS